MVLSSTAAAPDCAKAVMPVSPPLSPQERDALQRLADETAREDPAFAARLGGSIVPVLVRLSPLHWSWPTYLLVGITFLSTGLLLSVDSATAVGLISLIVACCRCRPAREAILRMLSGPADG